MNIKVTTSGDFSKTFKYLGNIQSFKRNKLMSILKKYGEKGVANLREMTPKDTGETAKSWS